MPIIIENTNNGFDFKFVEDDRPKSQDTVWPRDPNNNYRYIDASQLQGDERQVLDPSFDTTPSSPYQNQSASQVWRGDQPLVNATGSYGGSSPAAGAASPATQGGAATSWSPPSIGNPSTWNWQRQSTPAAYLPSVANEQQRGRAERAMRGDGSQVGPNPFTGMPQTQGNQPSPAMGRWSSPNYSQPAQNPASNPYRVPQPNPAGASNDPTAIMLGWQPPISQSDIPTNYPYYGANSTPPLNRGNVDRYMGPDQSPAAKPQGWAGVDWKPSIPTAPVQLPPQPSLTQGTQPFQQPYDPTAGSKYPQQAFTPAVPSGQIYYDPILNRMVQAP